MASSVLHDFLRAKSAMYRGLEDAKTAVEKTPEADQYFSKVQHRHENSLKNADIDNATRFVHISKTVMMEANVRCFDGKLFDGCRTFIDIGCAPGGFATYILDIVTDARYMGVTLPYDAGGHPLVVQTSERFWCLQVDIVENPSDIRYSQAEPAAGADTGELCDCAFLACSYLGGRKSHFMMPQLAGAQQEAHAKHHDEITEEDLVHEHTLLVAQLLIALQNLAEHGVLVMLWNTGPTPLLFSFLAVLWQTFDKVHAVKPLTNHNIRRSFYVVCRGCHGQQSPAVQAVLHSLRIAYAKLKSGLLIECVAVDEAMESVEDQQQRMSEILSRWGTSVSRLLEPIWNIQRFYLEEWLKNMRSGNGRGHGGMLTKHTRLCADNLHGHCSRRHCDQAHDWQQLKAAGVPLKRFVDKMQGPCTAGA